MNVDTEYHSGIKYRLLSLRWTEIDDVRWHPTNDENNGFSDVIRVLYTSVEIVKILVGMEVLEFSVYLLLNVKTSKYFKY